MENSKNEQKLDALLGQTKTFDPNRIKTAKEFMADKKNEENNNLSFGECSMAMGHGDEGCTDSAEYCQEEPVADYQEEPIEHSGESEITTSSI